MRQLRALHQLQSHLLAGIEQRFLRLWGERVDEVDERHDHGEHGEAHRLDISTLGEEEHLRRHERHRWIHR